jgi:hypothetical protein
MATCRSTVGSPSSCADVGEVYAMLWVIRRSLFSAVHAVPTATHGQTNVVIREGGACSAFASSCVKKIVKEPLPPSNSLHFRRPKKEPVVKKEPTSTSEVKKKLWWE